jgi:sugar (pentulose or hexulose) kinase
MMGAGKPRGIAVVDVGATNSKVALFDAALNVVAERKVASTHRPAPPYASIDPEPLAAFLAETLPALDQVLPIDTIVPAAHGAALALIAEDGSLAMPVMDYMAIPPDAVVAEYRKIEPPFSETFGPLLPMALTHGLQLYWQETRFPKEFARVANVVPWIQYVSYLLSGVAAVEISSISCQSQLVDVKARAYSSLARKRGWDRFFPPMAMAWDVLGPLKPEFRGANFQGRGAVLTGVHDSSANYLRYLAAGQGSFTLLSTGTWIIGFDTDADLDRLDKDRDTVSNTDVLGRVVASCRFFGGKEFEIIADGAPAEAARLETVERLMARRTMPLASFTDSGGPIPGTGGKGRITGPPVENAEERSSIAALYCALMCDQSLDAIGSKARIIIDGPFAENPVFLAILAALRPQQQVLASDLRDGTTAGAAVLALMEGSGRLPQIGLNLRAVAAARIDGLDRYREDWLKRSCAQA